MKLNKVVNFLKSKSLVDFVYLVMMILIVTMIKDMIVSMYKKRKDKQWLDQAFGKTKNKKNVEGFSSSFPVCSVNTDFSICTRLKYLLCNDKFSKLKKFLDEVIDISGDEVTIITDSLRVNNLKGKTGSSPNYSPIRSYSDIHMENKGVKFYNDSSSDPQIIIDSTDDNKIRRLYNGIEILTADTYNQAFNFSTFGGMINTGGTLPDDDTAIQWNHGENGLHGNIYCIGAMHTNEGHSHAASVAGFLGRSYTLGAEA